MDLPVDTPLNLIVDALKELNVSKAVVMGQSMKRIWDSECGDDYVFKASLQYPDLLLPFMSIEPTNRDGTIDRLELGRFKAGVSNGIRGVLITPPYGHFMSNTRHLYPFYELAQEKGIVVQFHHSANTGEKLVFAHHRYSTMSNLNDVLVDIPNRKVVVEHLGYPWTEELFTLMACSKNLYSDLALLYDQPTLTAWRLVMAKEYGVISRILYGSDYYSFRDDIAGYMSSCVECVEIGVNSVCERSGWPMLTDREIDGILYSNAARLYGF
jgi:predicted TIM-barrel fold metal-dependent hydrolase